ncbi:MAG: hypothetical protein WEB06_18025 [Actinomycetota bacterium]
MTRKTRIARTAAVIFAAAVAVFVGVMPATADVNTSSVKVTDPTDDEVIDGSFDSDGTPSGFKFTLKGQATTTCEQGWQTIKFTITGPSSVPAFSTLSSSDPSWAGSHPTQWNTQPLKNGIYTVRLDVTEKTTTNLLDKCPSDKPGSGSHSVKAKVANPAVAPEWSSAPVAASDGSASVTLRWKKNAEDDVLEYHILRSGPDGLKIAPVSASNPVGSGCSPLESNVYTCQDNAFPEAYTGDYNYGVVALRERPAYNSSEDEKIECQISSKPCVVSKGSQIQGVSLVAPTPTPTPTDQPSTPPPGTTAPGTPSSKPGASGGGSSGSGAPRVLSFGSSGGFYSGTYSETLPYQPRTMILGGGSATSSPQADGYQGEVVSETAPDFRTVMLPVAGGLLAFLSAAHVRRLLLHL